MDDTEQHLHDCWLDSLGQWRTYLAECEPKTEIEGDGSGLLAWRMTNQRQATTDAVASWKGVPQSKRDLRATVEEFAEFVADAWAWVEVVNASGAHRLNLGLVLALQNQDQVLRAYAAARGRGLAAADITARTLALPVFETWWEGPPDGYDWLDDQQPAVALPFDALTDQPMALVVNWGF